MMVLLSYWHDTPTSERLMFAALFLLTALAYWCARAIWHTGTDVVAEVLDRCPACDEMEDEFHFCGGHGLA